MKRRTDQEDKIKDLTDQLEKGIKEVFTSEKYKQYLSTMRKFHGYSFQNSLLIARQKPDATYIAGYKTWESMERHVTKGAKGIKILAPSPYKKTVYAEMIDPSTGLVKKDHQGNPVKERKEITYASFHVISVFDISQTEGKPLPELAKELQGNVSDYIVLMNSIKEIAPVPIRFETWDSKVKGYYDFGKKEVVIRSGMSELHTIKTAVHETAHSILHKDSASQKDPATMEVEAESVAYVLCQHLGLDTSDYSFSYLAGWSSNKELPELKLSLQTIQQTSNKLVEDIDRAILKYTTNLDISQTIAEELIKIPGIVDIHKHRR